LVSLSYSKPLDDAKCADCPGVVLDDVYTGSSVFIGIQFPYYGYQKTYVFTKENFIIDEEA
jgi:hypothetical protein